MTVWGLITSLILDRTTSNTYAIDHRPPHAICDELLQHSLAESDPFSSSKTFGKLSCKLCQKERVALLWHSWMDESNMLNDRSELHGSCRHTARFHRLFMRSGTDDPEQDERVVLCFGIFFQSGNWVRIRPHIQLQGSISGCGA
jgi:hypothetical protein